MEAGFLLESFQHAGSGCAAGAATGTKVRLSGEGEAGIVGGTAGDLYLIVNVEPDSQFERDGDNLTTEVKVDAFTAMLGGEVTK